MRQEARTSVFNLMACVAALMFVALVAMFGASGVAAGSRCDDGGKCCCRRAGDTGAGTCG
jgi:hypothetical protein